MLILISLHSWQFINIWFSRNRQLSWSKRHRRCLQATPEIIDDHSAQHVYLLPGGSVSGFIHGKVGWNHPEGLCSFDHLGFKVLMWITVIGVQLVPLRRMGFVEEKQSPRGWRERWWSHTVSNYVWWVTGHWACFLKDDWVPGPSFSSFIAMPCLHPFRHLLIRKKGTVKG